MSSESIRSRCSRFLPITAFTALLFLGSVPSQAAFAGRPVFDDSTVLVELSGWWGKIIESGRLAVTAIWADYGIAIDPNGAPDDTSRPVGPVDPTDLTFR